MNSITETSPLTEEQDQPLPPISIQYPSIQTPTTSFLKMGPLLGMMSKKQVVSEHRSLMRQVSKVRIMDSRCLEEPKDKPQISKYCTGPVLVPEQFASPSSSPSLLFKKAFFPWVQLACLQEGIELRVCRDSSDKGGGGRVQN